MILPIFQMAFEYSASLDKTTVVFPEEAKDELSFAFFLPISNQNINERGFNDRYIIPSINSNNQLVNTEVIVRNRFTRFPNERKYLSMNLFDTQIQFEFLSSAFINQRGFKEHEVVSPGYRWRNIYEIHEYSGKYSEYTKMFEGFLPLKISNSKSLEDIWSENRFSLVGFTPKFGSASWMEFFG